jgi:succinate-semialdehyde dehydrogenase/glutarate-semialdehyde dehydrogenase
MALSTHSPDPGRHARPWIAGAWRDGDASWINVAPATGDTVATCFRATPADVDQAVAAARVAYEHTRWSAVRERAGWAARVADALQRRAESLARTLAIEHGKPLREARAEVAAGVQGFARAAEWMRGYEGRVIPAEDPAMRVLTVHQPRGVWAALTPWNFPVNIPIEYLGPAIVTGSPVIWKPAPSTTLVATMVMEAVLEADLPTGLVQMVPSDETAVAQHLVTHPGVDAVALTGGSATGEAVAKAAWNKHLLLELGGNGPVVVLDDADLELAAHIVASSSFTNAGQVCSAAGRVLVAESVADELAARVVAAAASLVVGNPLEETVTMGPVHNAAVARTTQAHIADAVSRGATVLCGGSRVDGMPTELFVEPTVLDHVPVDAEIARYETFGPVAPLVRLAGDDALLQAANRSDLGLVAAVVTRSIDRAFRFAQRLEAGGVVVNATSNYWELHLPFGGWSGKRSGRGRLGGRAVLDEFCQSKTISIHVA